MIAPATRLVALLLVPVLRSRHEVRRTDDCAQPERVREVRLVPGTAKVVERWEKYGEDVPQWTEAELSGNDGTLHLRGALIRSFRPAQLYTRPPRVLLGKLESGQRLVEHVALDGASLPIQTLYDSSAGRNAMASYLFVYGSRPVEHPLLAQLASAPAQIWGGSRPLSLLIVAGAVPPERRPEARERAQRWLVAAWQHYEGSCL
jgi:hypothetical protein